MNAPRHKTGNGVKRLLFMVMGSVLLGLGFVILLGAVIRFAGGDLKASPMGYMAAVLLGGILPCVSGFYFIIKGWRTG